MFWFPDLMLRAYKTCNSAVCQCDIHIILDKMPRKSAVKCNTSLGTFRDSWNVHKPRLWFLRILFKLNTGSSKIFFRDLALRLPRSAQNLHNNDRNPGPLVTLLWLLKTWSGRSWCDGICVVALGFLLFTHTSKYPSLHVYLYGYLRQLMLFALDYM